MDIPLRKAHEARMRIVSGAAPMHPNLSRQRPLKPREDTGRMSLAQIIAVAGTWATLFAVGYLMLP